MIPFFSVLIPSYNRPEYIGELINSFLNGKFKDFEIIISDDCSPKVDELKQLIKVFELDHRVSFFTQENNIGEVGNKNFLVSKAKGQFNILIGDDDKFIPNSLSILHKKIIDNPNFDIYTFGYSTMNENSERLSKYVSPKDIKINLEDFKIASHVFCADMLPLWIFHPSTFCCRAGLEKSIGYSYEVGMAEDMYFIFEVLLDNKTLFVISEEIFQWRKIISKSKSDQLNQSSIYLNDIKARLKIYQQILKKYSFNNHFDFFISDEYVYRFLFKNIISDKTIVLSNLKSILFDDKELIETDVINKLVNLSKQKSTYIRINKFLLLPKRIFIFFQIFGFMDTIRFLFGHFSNKKIFSLVKS